LSEGSKIAILLFVSAALGVIFYFLFFAGEKEERYIFWNSTVTFIWQDASKADRDYAIGRGRYEVRLTNGTHVEARTYLNEKFEKFDCVRVRQLVFTLSAAPTYEIVGRVEECWKPD